MTNRERLNGMTDKELAEFLYKTARSCFRMSVIGLPCSEACPFADSQGTKAGMCEYAIESWLSEETSGDGE